MSAMHPHHITLSRTKLNMPRGAELSSSSGEKRTKFFLSWWVKSPGHLLPSQQTKPNAFSRLQVPSTIKSDCTRGGFVGFFQLNPLQPLVLTLVRKSSHLTGPSPNSFSFSGAPIPNRKTRHIWSCKCTVTYTHSSHCYY